MPHNRLCYLFVLLLASAAIASPVAPHLTAPVLKSRHPAPAHFEKRGRVGDDVILDMRIGLKQRNMDVLERRLHRVADPAHSEYGRHLSQAELRALIAPEASTLEAVSGWLLGHGITAWTVDNNDFVHVNVPVRLAEKLLDTHYYVYHDVETGHFLVRTEEYKVPEGLSDHIDLVQPTNYFGTVHRMGSTIHDISKKVEKESAKLKQLSNQLNPECGFVITPNCLRALYKTTDYTATSKTNKLGIAGFLQQYAAQSDLDLYVKDYRTDIKEVPEFSVETIKGTHDPAKPGGEASLDVQTAVGIAYPTPVTYYYTDGSPPFNADAFTTNNTNEPYIEWTDYMLGLSDSDIPNTISVSYGENEQTVPLDYAVKVCNAFMQMGARGQTILVASGDFGVGPPASDQCTSLADGSNIFLPGFPASCPYVTTVGGTVGTGPETAASFSGAGFSNYFAQPSWQTDAVSSYVDNTVKSLYAGKYNQSGRAYPDVAGQARNFGTYIGGDLMSVSGTSASTPAVAAVISQLNDVLVSDGKPPLGWANPWIYGKASSGFTDVTSGASSGCGTDGFSTASGWDASTGFGTPDFVKLRALLP